MISFLVTWAVYAIAIFIIGKAIPNVEVRSPLSAIVIAAIYGVIAWLIGRFFWSQPAFTGQIGMIWQLLGYTVTNMILLKLTDWFTSRLKIRGIGALFLAGLLMSVLVVGAGVLRTRLGI